MTEAGVAIDSKRVGVRNERRVLALLSREGQLSQSQLCKLAGFSSSTASYIMGRLREKNLISETQGESRKRGAKPVIVSINPSGRWVAGVEISPSYLHLGLFNFCGTLCDSIRIGIAGNLDPAHVCELAEVNLRGLLGRNDVAEGLLLGIGVTLSGTLTADGVVQLSSPLGWKDVPLQTMLQQRFSAEVSLHSTRVRLLAEEEVGQGDRPQNVFYLNVANGVGGHVIMDGRLLHGASNRSAEIGHIVVDPGGPVCGCGLQGCLEALISGPALARRIRQDLAGGRETWLKGRIDGEQIPEEVVSLWGEALAGGDAYALELRDFVTRHVCWAAALGINCYDPNTLILAGYVTTQCREHLIKAIEGRIATAVYDPRGRAVMVQAARAGDEALIRGAATAILRAYMEIA